MDVLINNAGIAVRASLPDTTDELWDYVLQTNLASAFYMARAVVPTMQAGGGGAIVNIASINAIRGNLELTAYGASKGGMTAMTRVMAMELAPDNIRVNALCPGTVHTPMNDQYLASVADREATIEMLAAKHPMGRIATADDVAWAALFLASDRASFITGVSLPVDGGRHLGR